VAARYKAWVCDCSFAGIAFSHPRRGHGCLSSVSVVGCIGRGLCNGQIPCPVKAYQVCVCVSLDVIKYKPSATTMSGQKVVRIRSKT